MSESETPVRPKRVTRSRTAQSSTSSRVTRNSRAASKKADQKESDVPESSGNRDKVAKVTLPSVSETTEQAVMSPDSAASVSSSTASGNESEKSAVLQRARAYENMISQRNQGSPKSASKETSKSAGEGTPKSASKESQPCITETEPTDFHSDSADTNVVDTSRSSQRSSVMHRRSSAAGKRTSLKVLGSKARLRSLQGRLSVTGPLASLTRQAAQEVHKVSQEELAAKQAGKQAEQPDKENLVSQVFVEKSSNLFVLFLNVPASFVTVLHVLICECVSSDVVAWHPL